MLFSALISFFLSLFGLLVAILPMSSGFDYRITQSINFLSPYWATLSDYFPIADMIQIMLLVLSLEFFILAFNIGNFIYNKIRG